MEPMEIKKVRKRPVEVQAVLFTGENFSELKDFTNGNFGRVHPDDRTEDPDITAEVFYDLHSTWVGVKDGQWIIRGVQGEFYPCDPDIFDRTYAED